MINILLCDDDEKTLNWIRDYIDSIRSEIKYEINMESYTMAESVLQRLRNLKECSDKECGDILITDIKMPVLSGMEMARVIRDENLDVILIFMTSYAEYVFSSFEYAPFRYIRKEFMEIELLPALLSACHKIDFNRSISLAIKTKDGIMSIKTGDILYYELENRKCIIYTIQNKHYETWRKISELWDEIDKNDKNFMQIYRGCVVNKRYVKIIRNETIVLEDGKELPISRRKKHEISDIMMDYWEKIL